jgi:A/G-specific adenine glycosylase
VTAPPLAEALLPWFDATARPLAWRRTRDPWLVLLSEVLAQQTQAARAEAAWTAFAERFPTPAAMAEAPLSEVLLRWRGLGYNRRAVNLHRTACVLVERHGGRVPEELSALRDLPGVGPYTARAVRAFAFGADDAPVDTNVARVLSRAVAGAPLRGRALQASADGLVPTRRGREWSAALMDLGATICTARSPRCDACPIAPGCVWQDVGGPDPWASARVRPPAPFAGSDRQHRGRLVDALRSGGLPWSAVPEAAGLPSGARLDAIVAGLVADGLIRAGDAGLDLAD